MTTRRRGWDFAQLRTSFAADPEFQALARKASDDTAYLAGVGLWALALAQSWRDDDPEIADLMSTFDAPEIVALLERADLVEGGVLRGYGKHTAAVREARAADAERKRHPMDSAGLRRPPPE